MSKEMNVDITALLMAVVNDFGGELVISPKSLKLDYAKKCLVPDYYPERDLYVLRLENLEDYEDATLEDNERGRS